MILTSDYHTHTVFSHGKGNIIDNALVAKEKGLKDPIFSAFIYPNLLQFGYFQSV